MSTDTQHTGDARPGNRTHSSNRLPRPTPTSETPASASAADAPAGQAPEVPPTSSAPGPASPSGSQTPAETPAQQTYSAASGSAAQAASLSSAVQAAIQGSAASAATPVAEPLTADSGSAVQPTSDSVMQAAARVPEALAATSVSAAPAAALATRMPITTPAPSTPPATPPGETGLSRLGPMIRNFAAPTTLVTALLFFFGWSHAYWFFDYFGVNSTTIGLTTQDYLMRSQDSLFIPLAAGACLFLLYLLGRRVFKEFVVPRMSVAQRRLLVLATMVVGCVLVAAGLLSIVVSTPLRSLVGAPGLCLVGGVVLVVAAVRLRRTDRGGAEPDVLTAGEWGAVFVLVGVGLFWAVADYSAAVGTGRAIEQVEQFADQPSVSVYSDQRLGLAAPGVTELACPAPDAAYHFRYDGLKLVLQSGNQYLLLPESWDRSGGVAFLLPRSDANRIDFFPPGAIPPAHDCR